MNPKYNTIPIDAGLVMTYSLNHYISITENNKIQDIIAEKVTINLWSDVGDKLFDQVEDNIPILIL